MTLELNEQQVNFLKETLEFNLKIDELSNTGKAITLQIINKLEN